MTTVESSPRVSVVIPTRNRLPLLAQTLHTVLAQDVELEAIVVDEASTDDTPIWLADHPDARVRTIRHDTPKGLSNARNAGIAAATGHWLGFTDDDDLWLPDKLTRQLAAARENGSPWAYGREFVFTDEPRLLHVSGPELPPVSRLPWTNTIPGGGSNVIVTKQAITLAGGFDPSVDIVADWDMWIRLAQLAPPSVVSDLVLAYRVHQGSMSNDPHRMLCGVHEIERRYAPLRDGAVIDWPDTYRWLSRRAWLAGDRRAARQVAFSALRSGHSAALRDTARAFVPVGKRLPVADPADAEDGLLGKVRPRPVVPWPPGTERWLRSVLEISP